MMLTNCMSFSTSFSNWICCHANIGLLQERKYVSVSREVFFCCFEKHSKVLKFAWYKAIWSEPSRTTGCTCNNQREMLLFISAQEHFFHTHVSKSFALPVFRGHWGFQLLTQPAVCVSCWPHKIHSHWIQMPHRILISVWFTLRITFHLGHTLFFTTVEYK